MPEEKVESVKGMTLTADGNGAVFDVPVEDLDLFLSGIFLLCGLLIVVMVDKLCIPICSLKLFSKA